MKKFEQEVDPFWVLYEFSMYFVSRKKVLLDILITVFFLLNMNELLLRRLKLIIRYFPICIT